VSPVIPWAMVIATVFVSSFLAHRLQNAKVGTERVEFEVGVEVNPLTVTG
jgi:hypothetical protein